MFCIVKNLDNICSMVLGFKTQFKGAHGIVQTYFKEKINACLAADNVLDELIPDMMLRKFAEEQFHCSYLAKHFAPKRHTFRHDDANRWKKERKVDFYYHNRTKKAERIAPAVLCTGTQRCVIDGVRRVVNVDGKILNDVQLNQFSKNDGFDHIYDMWAWFGGEVHHGKLIHWTSLRY